MPSPAIYRTVCGDYVFSESYYASHQPYFVFSSNTVNYAAYNGTGLETYKSYTTDYSWQNQGGETWNYRFSGAGLNGHVLKADAKVHQDFSPPSLTPSPLKLSNTQNSTTVYEKELTAFEMYPFRELVQLGQHYYLLNQDGNKITLTPVECDNNQPLVVAVPEITKQHSSISVYPNPGYGQFYLNGLQGNCRLSLFNSTGNLIHQQELYADASGNTVYQIGEVPAGIYMLNILQDSGRSTLKLIDLLR